VEKHTSLKFSKSSIEGVYNYLKVGDELTTSGQPSAEQFVLIKAAGYKTIINLAPHNAENSLRDEAALLDDLGLDYIHIPVDFRKPSKANFEKFVATINDVSLSSTWIHCAANMRVSAFVYKYRCEVLKEPSELARKDLDKIWEPMGVWKKFIFAD